MCYFFLQNWKCKQNYVRYLGSEKVAALRKFEVECLRAFRIVRGLEDEGLIKSFKTVIQHDGLSQTVSSLLKS